MDGSPQPSITDVVGVEVGHWSDPIAKTGCTVVTFPLDNVGAGEIRGAYPASREFATLACGMNTDAVDAVVFSGGSSFGLAAAEGVMGPIEHDRTADLGVEGYLPFVPSAVVYDLGVGDGSVRPTAAAGAAAYAARSSDPVERGTIGAGTGTTVAKWRGPAATVPGGVGSWSVRVGAATVGVLTVVNAVGDLFTVDGRPLTGGPAEPEMYKTAELGPRENTTLAVLATDASVGRSDLLRLLVRMHDAYGACLRPAHTRWDGDACVAVSCGPTEVGLDELGEAAFIATGRALADAVAPR